MKLIIFFLLSSIMSFGQGVLNGSFENNTITECTYNQNSTNFNLAMPNVNSYGTTPQIDIQNSINCDIVPQHGNWCIGIASFPWGGSDAVTLELLSPLSIDSLYHLKFWTFNNTTYASTNGIALDSIRIGLTTNNNSSNKTIYTSFPTIDTWVEHTISFVADSNYTFISVDMKNDFNSATWIQIDNFSITNATIGGEVFGVDIRTECDSLVWLDGNIYYSDNNTATYNFIGGGINYNDSIVSLNLAIVNSTSGTDYRTECYAYTWIDGINYIEDNNTATYTLTNSVGCDSIVTLDLTVNNTTSYDYQTACDSFTWIDGNTYTSNNNTATYVLPNSVGCDSIITLYLTINSTTTDIDIQTACGPYVWIDGNTYTTNNNSATHTMTNPNGCEYIVTLNLTIIDPVYTTESHTVCDPFLWIDGNTYSSSNNTATHILNSSNGCDSIITLDLMVHTIDKTLTGNNSTLTSNESGAGYQWLSGITLQPIIGATNQSYVITTNDFYAVIITKNGCIDTSEIYILANLGINEYNFSDEIRLFPNPTKGNFSLDLGKNYKHFKITLTDLNGKIISSNIYSNTQFLNLKLDQPAGSYLLIIDSGEKKAFIQIIKE